MEYNVVQLTEVVFYRNDTEFSGSTSTNEVQSTLGRLLKEGYEIYKAIPLVNEGGAVIKYILRKETNE